jgi:hypothetical protein
VVKNGSKMRARVSALIPLPVSDTSITTYSPLGSPSSRYVDASSSALAVTRRVETVITPPAPASASAALVTRFMTTCRSCVASPSTVGSVGAKS